MKDFDQFFKAYIAAALWSTNDNSDEQGGEPLDKNYLIEDFDGESLETLKAHARSFYSRMWYYIENESDDIGRKLSCSRNELAGNDFWLTSNGHGANFLDGDWPVYGQMLFDLSKHYPQIDLYIGDDNLIHL